MKRSVWTKMKLGITFLLSILIVSCTSDDDNSNVDENTGVFLRADVEDLNFESSNTPNGVTAAKIEGGQATVYVVQGFDNGGNAIVLTIADYNGTGTYDFAFSQDSAGTVGQFSDQNTAWSTAGDNGSSGSITVTTDDDEETSGRFEFTGIDVEDGVSTKTVRNGSFRVRF